MGISQLNPPQRKAVQTLSGPLLVLAGAGTGKTRVVTFRIAELIRHKTAPDRILAVTFTNKAALEMQQRVASLLGRKAKKRPVISTFHSHCLQVLRRHITQLGYPAKFAIYDRGDQESIARSVLRELRVPGQQMRPGDLLAMVSQWKSKATSPAEAASRAGNDKEHLGAAGYRRYQTALKNAGAVDFDDLLLCTEELFRRYPDTRQEEAARFDHVLIDEYQDTNGTQYRIVKALASAHRNLCVVGDDDQSIYGWRGAEVEHILNFRSDWPDATVVRLEDNYRSTSAIIEYANRLIAFNSKRHDKVLRAARAGGEPPRIDQYKDETEEARGVVADIGRRLTAHEHSARDFAILFRTNEQPRAFETELRKRKIPYVMLGASSFFDRKEVRDIVAFLKTCASPDDEVSILRIINKPPRGISAQTVEKLIAAAVADGKSVWKVMTSQLPSLPDKAAESVARFVRLIRAYQGHFERAEKKTKGLAQVLRSLIDEIRYAGELQRLYNDPTERESRWAAVEEVVNALGAYENKARRPQLRNFLDDIALNDRDMDQDKEKQLKQDAVALMTLHSAKGLEFPFVYMVGMEEGILPHRRSTSDEAIDEERRLCYVGITRAQERLTLSLPLTRMKWGKPRETMASRFLYELIGQAENPRARPQKKRPARR